ITRRDKRCKTLQRRRLCRRLMGILLPRVRGGAGMVTGAFVALDVDEGLAPYGRSKRLTTGFAGVSGSAPGGSSVQSAGAGRASNPSSVATGTTMLIRFSTRVS